MDQPKDLLWAWKCVEADLTARGYQYRLGDWNTTEGPFTINDACPAHEGDGLCLATNFAAAAAANRSCRTVLFCGYRAEDVLFCDEKIRVKRVWIYPQIISVELLLKSGACHGANLRGADLRGANLYGANLEDLTRRGANL